MPRLSVIVPIYDVERFLPECLESLCGQGFDASRQSSSTTGRLMLGAAIAERFVERDPRFRLVRQRNGGLGSARNAGVGGALVRGSRLWTAARSLGARRWCIAPHSDWTSTASTAVASMVGGVPGHRRSSGGGGCARRGGSGGWREQVVAADLGRWTGVPDRGGARGHRRRAARSRCSRAPWTSSRRRCTSIASARRHAVDHAAPYRAALAGRPLSAVEQASAFLAEHRASA